MKALHQRIYSPPPLPLGTLTLVLLSSGLLSGQFVAGQLVAKQLLPKPTMGLEPITFALQEHCSAN
jgi:hypothetical protein